jgi:hypothetical protein
VTITRLRRRSSMQIATIGNYRRICQTAGAHAWKRTS